MPSAVLPKETQLMFHLKHSEIMGNIRCKRDFKRKPIEGLDTFSTGVRDGIYTNPAIFTTPPITQMDYQAIIDGFINTRAAYKNGGSAQKGPYETARDTLFITLTLLADYVDTVALGSSAIITTAGFVPTKGTASERPKPDRPTGVTLDTGSTGVLLAECDSQPYVDTYLCLLSANEPLPASVSVNSAGQIVALPDSSPTAMASGQVAFSGPAAIIDLNKSRKKVFTGLVPGVMYYVTYVAINAQGVSDLSAPVGRMCGS